VFSSSETVLFSLSPLQVRKIGESNPVIGARINEWLGNPSKVLSAILAGNTLVNFAIASLGFRLFLVWMPECASWMSALVFTLLLLLFGEICPKQYALRYAERLAPVCVRTLMVFMALLKPFVVLMTAGSGMFRNLLSRERRALSDDEFKVVVEAAAAAGVLDNEEVSMVRGVMRLPDLYAINEMTPRVRLEGIEESLSEPEKRRMLQETDFPYLPAYIKDFDHITGFVDVKAALAHPDAPLSDFLSPPLRVEEHDGLDDLLVLFVKTGKRIALVEDRWGGTAGVITRGDILELIVKPVEEDE
jgi:CBS domain containing-hemolysin-like protein